MATYNKFLSWSEDESESVNTGTDQFVVALCAAANAPVNTNTVLADLTQISYTNLSSRNLTTAASAQTAGTFKLDFNDLVLTAGGGAVAAFQYVVIYDDTPTSPADPLVCWFDYGSALTLADGESLTLTFHANGLYTKA
jgi:hypothetical protein